jgi:hypothetical protein
MPPARTAPQETEEYPPSSMTETVVIGVAMSASGNEKLIPTRLATSRRGSCSRLAKKMAAGRAESTAKVPSSAPSQAATGKPIHRI